MITNPLAKQKTQLVRSEIGMFPSDWPVRRLDQIAGGVSVGLVINPSTYISDQGTVPMLLGSQVMANKIDHEAARRITPQSNAKIPASILRAGDLVTVRVGDPGTTAVIADELDGCNCASMMIVRRGASFNSAWLSHLMNSPLGRRQVANVQYGTAQKQFNIGDAVAFLFPVPAKAEQDAIAEALTDADTLIDSLKQVLTKKRQIKQGAMQELLTGKRRLPGFQQPWSEIRLGDVGRTFGGLTGKGKADFGHGAAKYITFMNVMTTVRTSTEMVESVEVGPLESQSMVQTGDLLFNGSSETPDEVALCSWVEACDEGVFLNSFCFGFRPFTTDRLSGLFMAYFFRGRPGRAAVSSLAQGATRYNIAKTALLQAPLCLPTFAEQQAIAEVLSSMDTEIAALESRLTKARALKQAMAQTLLTGRIRLVEPTA